MTIGDYLARAAALWPDRPAVVRADGGPGASWSELDRLADRCAAGFLQLGVRPGERVVLWAANRPEWVACFLGLCRMGGVCVPANIHFRRDELLYLLRKSEARAMVFMDGFRGVDYVAVAREIWGSGRAGSADLAPDLRTLIHFGAKPCPEAFDLERVASLGGLASGAALSRAGGDVRPSDAAVVQFTSGSTRRPRGAVLSHRNVVENSFLSGRRLGLDHRDLLCLSVPFFHCFGLSAGILMCVGQGAAMVLLDSYRPLDVMRAVQAHGCTALHGVPTMFQRILAHEAFGEHDFSSLRTGIVAGGLCCSRLLRDIVERMHMPELAVAYGQTETSPCCTQTEPGDALELRMETVGKPLPGVEMAVRHPRTRRPCAAGETGELYTRGPHVMRGYAGKPELTARVLDAEGWYRTGDSGFLDAEGNLHFQGRLREIINRGGENISPREIESVILGHEAVQDVKVFGVAESALGEEVAAAVCLHPGRSLEEGGLRDYLLTRIARYKVPKFIDFYACFPCTGSGKPDVSALRGRMQERIDVGNRVSGRHPSPGPGPAAQAPAGS